MRVRQTDFDDDRFASLLSRCLPDRSRLGEREHFRRGDMRDVSREKGFRDFVSFFRICDTHVFDLCDSFSQRHSGDILYLQSRPGIDLEDFRTCRRDRPVHSEIAEIDRLLSAAGL